jgi:hypothetical protein
VRESRNGPAELFSRIEGSLRPLWSTLPAFPCGWLQTESPEEAICAPKHLFARQSVGADSTRDAKTNDEENVFYLSA